MFMLVFGGREGAGVWILCHFITTNLSSGTAGQTLDCSHYCCAFQLQTNM